MRHNPRRCGPDLPLSAVGAGGRLTHTVPRYIALVPTVHRGISGNDPAFAGNEPARRRRRHPTELIAARIRADGGDVWGAVLTFGVSYGHACRIRAGWRPGGRRAAPIDRERAA